MTLKSFELLKCLCFIRFGSTENIENIPYRMHKEAWWYWDWRWIHWKVSTHRFYSGVLCFSNVLCYFIDEMMEVCCFDPQIRRPPGTSVLLILCLSATSPAAALSQKVWRRTRTSYGLLKLLPALTQNGGYNLSPFVCSLVSEMYFLPGGFCLCVFIWHLIFSFASIKHSIASKTISQAE